MEKYIKYKRITVEINEAKSQDFLDNLVTEGWEIINYSESLRTIPSEGNILFLVVIVGKRQNNVI